MAALLPALTRALAALAAPVLVGCSAAAPTSTLPARALYLQGQTLEDQGLYTESIEKFQTMVSQNPGTRLGAYGYVRLAELYSRQEDWLQAETNYRLFLSAESNSYLTPYVIYRLLLVNHEKSFTGVFFRAKEVDRDMEPNRQIMLEYKRFYLLYPQSAYLPEVTPVYTTARDTLAEHELVVAEFYWRHGQFNAAAGRYFYILRNFPDFPRSEYVLRRLIAAYRRDQQLDLAAEMQRILDLNYGARGAKTAQAADGSGSPGALAPAPPGSAPATGPAAPGVNLPGAISPGASLPGSPPPASPRSGG